MGEDPLERAARSGSHRLYIRQLLRQTTWLQDLKKKKLTGSELEAALDQFFDDLNKSTAARLVPFLSEQPVVVRSEDELKELAALYRQGHFKDIERWFDHRLGEVKKWWKDKLRIPPHRRADLEKMEMYSEAARLRETEKLSWARLARKLDPKGYSANPRACIDRFRKGVGKCKRLTWDIYTKKC